MNVNHLTGRVREVLEDNVSLRLRVTVRAAEIDGHVVDASFWAGMTAPIVAGMAVTFDDTRVELPTGHAYDVVTWERRKTGESYGQALAMVDTYAPPKAIVRHAVEAVESMGANVTFHEDEEGWYVMVESRRGKVAVRKLHNLSWSETLTRAGLLGTFSG